MLDFIVIKSNIELHKSKILSIAVIYNSSFDPHSFRVPNRAFGFVHHFIGTDGVVIAQAQEIAEK